MIAAWARLIAGRPWVGWMIWGVISAVVVFGLSRLRFEEDLRDSFRPKTAEAAMSEGMLAEFATFEDAFLVLVEGDGFFEGGHLEALEDFDFELRGVEGTRRVFSIFDIRSTSAVDGYFPPLLPGPGAAEGELRAAEEAARNHPMVRDVLLSETGDSLLFFVVPGIPSADRLGLLRMAEEIEVAGGRLSEATGFEVGVSGLPALHPVVVETIVREQILYAAGGAVLGALIGWLLFRSVAAVILVFLVPQVSSSWVLGVMGLVGEPVGILNSMVMVLVLILALANTMHMVLAVCRHGAAGRSPRKAAIAATAEVGSACFLTSLTTAIAFGSLVFSDNRMVVHFGLVCAAGTLLMFGAVVLIVPLLTSIGWFGRSLARSPVAASGRSRGYLRLGEFSLAHSGVIFAIGVAVLAGAVGAGASVRPEFSYRENLAREAPGAEMLARIDRAFGGSQPMYFIVTSEVPFGELPEDVLDGFLGELHVGLEGGAPGGVPQSLLNLSQAVGKPVVEVAAEMPEEDRAAIVDFEGLAMLVTLPLPDAGAQRLIPVMSRATERAERVAAEFEAIEVRPAGLLLRSIHASDDMIREMALSLAAAGVLIFGIIMLALRSVVLGAISFLPNLLPLAVTFGLLGILGEPLRYNSALALTICLGVAVDDTVHLLFRYRRARQEGFLPADAVRTALPAVGAALVNSTLILTAGLGMLLFSSLPTIRLFGVICIVTFLIALAADLILLPAMLRLFDRRGA